MTRKPYKFTKAKETYVIVRELSSSRGGCFRWYQFRDAYKAVTNPSKMTINSGWKNSLGHVLRAMLIQGLIEKCSKGLYRFTKLGLKADFSHFVQYVSPHEAPCINYVKNAHRIFP